MGELTGNWHCGLSGEYTWSSGQFLPCTIYLVEIVPVEEVYFSITLLGLGFLADPGEARAALQTPLSLIN